VVQVEEIDGLINYCVQVDVEVDVEVDVVVDVVLYQDCVSQKLNVVEEVVGVVEEDVVE
jgi:hypothetical protein